MAKSKTKKQIVQWAVRLLLLGLFVFFVLGGPVPHWLARVLPGFSPLVALSDTVAARSWYLTLFWLVPPVLVLVLAVTRGRIWCNWICPMGTLVTAPRKLSFKKKLLKKPIAGYIFWLIIGSSLVGGPLLLFLDPLAMTNRSIVLVAEGSYHAAALVPGLILPAVLVLGLFQPMFWCSHVCPLGYMRRFAERVRKEPKRTFRNDRRQILVGVGAGVPLAFLAKALPMPGTKPSSVSLPVLPPGALKPDLFALACSRCGACVDACPSGVLRFAAKGDRKLIQLCQPEMDPSHGACDEFCTKCTEVCSTGAIRQLTEDQKRHTQVGIAEVDRLACLAWAKDEYCMVCDEYCPYNAIETDEDGDIPRPIVNADRCRGCGWCQNACPAEEHGVAIIVQGVERQRDLHGAGGRRQRHRGGHG